MKIYRYLFLSGMVVAALCPLQAQFTVFQPSPAPAQAPVPSPPPVEQLNLPECQSGIGQAQTEMVCLLDMNNDKKGDAGYEAYKKGYDFILDEDWEEAVKQLKIVLTSFPKSQYVDDATYWIAYAYKSIDTDKAREQYKKFIKNYPGSKYYDDAVADLSEIDGNIYVTIAGDSQNIYIGQGKSRGTGKGSAVGNGFATAYSYGTGTTMSLARQQYSLSQTMVNNKLRAMGQAPVAWPVPGRGPTPRAEEKLDSETQLKLDVLYALGDKKDDENAYTALRDIAVDPKQNKSLRVAAMDELAEFKKHDPLSVYVEIAKRDTSEEIQNLAIDYIGTLSNNKNRSVETLSELFSVIPKYRTSQLQAVLSSIAEIGNDKAVEFLGGVARANSNYDLRRDAVYYLGGIGNEKARTTLLEILKVKN